MNNFQETIISEYANSPVLLQLVTNMDAYIDPDANLDAFYGTVWNVLTAQGFGLDIWGQIVGVTRGLNIPEDTPNPGGYPFTPGTYSLGDNDYRKVILVKALGNITDCSTRSINQLLTNMFVNQGRAYALDNFSMSMTFTFEFYLQPYEYAIVTTSGAIPHPVGVQFDVFQVDVANTFGFAESVQLQPFDHGTFFNG
jgi:uncharacterized protein DUF2612